MSNMITFKNNSWKPKVLAKIGKIESLFLPVVNKKNGSLRTILLKNQKMLAVLDVI